MARLGKGVYVQSRSIRKRMRAQRTCIVDQCLGCNKIDNEKGSEPNLQDLCQSYVSPEKMWRRSKKCPLASHLIIEEKSKERKRVGQQKQKKQSIK